MCTDGGQADKTGTQGTYPISPWHTDSSPPSPPAPALTPGTEAVRLGAAGGWARAGSSQKPAPPSEGLAGWERAPGFRHPVPAPTTATGPTGCLPCVPPPKPAGTLVFHTPKAPPGLPQQPLQKPTALEALVPGGRRCRVGQGRGGHSPLSPTNAHTHSRRGYALASEPRRLVSAASRPLTGCPAPGVPLSPETWGSWEGRECLLCSRGSPQ